MFFKKSIVSRGKCFLLGEVDASSPPPDASSGGSKEKDLLAMITLPSHLPSKIQDQMDLDLAAAAEKFKDDINNYLNTKYSAGPEKLAQMKTMTLL